jgi:hypothetical protein
MRIYIEKNQIQYTKIDGHDCKELEGIEGWRKISISAGIQF